MSSGRSTHHVAAIGAKAAVLVLEAALELLGKGAPPILGSHPPAASKVGSAVLQRTQGLRDSSYVLRYLTACGYHHMIR